METKEFTKEKFISLYKKYSVKELAEKIGVCETTIWIHAKKLGLSKYKSKLKIK